MLFNSVTFAVFLPIVFLLYYIVPHKYRWVFLLLASYAFYMNLHVGYGLLLLFTTVLTYVLALKLAAAPSKARRKLCLWGGVLPLVCILLLYKTATPLIGRLNEMIAAGRLSLQPITLSILMPAGVSFYFFQSMGYLIDVYRGKIKAERHFGYYALFVSFFPQLLAGPIGRADGLLPQYRKRRPFDYANVTYGLKLMAWGYYKKLVVADVLAVTVNSIYDNAQAYVGLAFIVATVMFAVEIYCDFSGYSDMAIGIASIMGFRLAQNFDFPYKSRNVTEFWRRWHISLSSWLRDYIYIPLGGNRKGRYRTYVNSLVTMLVGGLWHGAAWKFVFWGGMHGLGLAVHKASAPMLRRVPDNRFTVFVSWAMCMVFVAVLWVFFRAESWTASIEILRSVGRDFSVAAIPAFASARSLWLFLLIAIAVAHALPEHFHRRAVLWFVDSPWIIKLLIFIAVVQCVLELRTADVSPFIYFQF